jgi:hypothetical protein
MQNPYQCSLKTTFFPPSSHKQKGQGTVVQYSGLFVIWEASDSTDAINKLTHFLPPFAAAIWQTKLLSIKQYVYLGILIPFI